MIQAVKGAVLKVAPAARERVRERRKRPIRQETLPHELHKEVNGYQASIRALEKEELQLKASLMDETRVKIELFTALSDTRRKQQSLAEECREKMWRLPGSGEVW